MRKIHFPLIFIVLFLSGCASVMTYTTQIVSVNVLDAKTRTLLAGTQCSVTVLSGRVYKLTSNPGNVTLIRNTGALAVSCHKKGYYQKAVGKAQSKSLKDVVFWPGGIVDSADSRTIAHPAYITVLMQLKS